MNPRNYPRRSRERAAPEDRLRAIRRTGRQPEPLSLAPTPSRQALRQAVPKNSGGSRRVVRLHFVAWALGKVLALAILGVGLWGLVALLGDTRFQVRQLAIDGAALVPAEEIQQTLAVEGTNVFFVRSSRLERRLRLNPAIGRARVEPRLPDLAYVRVAERKPSVLWDGGGEPALVDATGLVIREAIDTPPQLPRVHAPGSPAVRAGERVDPSPVHVAEAVAPRLDALGLSNARLEYRPESGVTILGPYRVAIGSEDQIEAKLAAYESIRRHLQQSRTRAELVDVRFLDRPYYR